MVRENLGLPRGMIGPPEAMLEDGVFSLLYF